MKLKKSVLDVILERKKRAIREADDRLSSALENAEFKKKYLKVKALSFDLAKAEYENLNADKTRKELAVAQKEAEETLKKMGLSFKSFEPNFTCKKCNDEGLIGDKPCSCYFEELSHETKSNLGGNIDKMHTFENSNFDLFDKKDEYKKNFDKLQKWSHNVDNSQYKNLLLCGKTGVGKTYLSECLLNEFLGENKSVLFYSAFALDNLFLKFHTTFDSTKEGLLDGVLNCDVLAIDDLGSEPIYKNVTAEYLFLIVGERLSHNKTTIVTTNLNFDSIIDRYGERTFSRLCNKRNTVILKMDNSDLRLNR